jgi:hypothetical protein
MKKNTSRLRLKAFFFIYYDQVLNNLYLPETLHTAVINFIVFSSGYDLNIRKSVVSSNSDSFLLTNKNIYLVSDHRNFKTEIRIKFVQNK